MRLNIVRYCSCIMFIAFLASCSKTVESTNTWFKDRNVCKKLVGKVLVYPVFVQEKKGEKWSLPDTKEFGDSLQVALNWIEKCSKQYNADVRFDLQLHPKVIVKGFPQKTIAETIESIGNVAGLKKFNKHYDGISKSVGSSIPKEEQLKPFVGAVKDKERLIAKLRNTYQVESVVLMFIHKPVGIDHFYITLNSLSNDDVEYMVSTFRSPTVLANQMLELFGAAPLMYDKSKKKEEKSWEYVQDHFPNDVMANLGKTIHACDVGQYNAYLLGWTRNSNPDYEKLLPLRSVYKK